MKCWTLPQKSNNVGSRILVVYSRRGIQSWVFRCCRSGYLYWTNCYVNQCAMFSRKLKAVGVSIIWIVHPRCTEGYISLEQTWLWIISVYIFTICRRNRQFDAKKKRLIFFYWYPSIKTFMTNNSIICHLISYQNWVRTDDIMKTNSAQGDIVSILTLNIDIQYLLNNNKTMRFWKPSNGTVGVLSSL